MSGTAFISPSTAWGVASRAFIPIVERIRLGYSEMGWDAPESIFSSLDSGLDIISLEELPLDEFNRFVVVSQNQLDRLMQDESLSLHDRQFLSSPWTDMQNLLRQDERYSESK